MLELSNERIEQILHEGTAKKEEQATVLRGIYTRYMILYEGYFADIAALNDDKISELSDMASESYKFFINSHLIGVNDNLLNYTSIIYIPEFKNIINLSCKLFFIFFDNSRNKFFNPVYKNFDLIHFIKQILREILAFLLP